VLQYKHHKAAYSSHKSAVNHEDQRHKIHTGLERYLTTNIFLKDLEHFTVLSSEALAKGVHKNCPWLPTASPGGR